MNKWKLAFWICFTVLILVSATALYCIVDQAVSLSYLQEGYEDTEKDLENISNFLNTTDLSKTQIKKSLIKHPLYKYMDFQKDTISLETVSLIFKNNYLTKIDKL